MGSSSTIFFDTEVSQCLIIRDGASVILLELWRIAYSLLEEQEGKKWMPDDYISFVDLLADERYRGVAYDEEEVRGFLRKDPEFWRHRPWTTMMK